MEKEKKIVINVDNWGQNPKCKLIYDLVIGPNKADIEKIPVINFDEMEPMNIKPWMDHIIDEDELEKKEDEVKRESERK